MEVENEKVVQTRQDMIDSLLREKEAIEKYNEMQRDKEQEAQAKDIMESFDVQNSVDDIVEKTR